MKQTLLMIAVVALVGCGSPQATQPTTANPKAPKPEPTKAKATVGVKLWEFETGYGVYSSPAIGSDGTVYVGSKDNKLYAIKTDSKGLAKSPWPMRGQNARHTGRDISP
jgi:outer membrane protein assembly factor BamB